MSAGMGSVFEATSFSVVLGDSTTFVSGDFGTGGDAQDEVARTTRNK